MNDCLKLYWEMRYKSFPNERYLKGFDNLLTAYLPNDQGRILDIGCGQSEFIIDMLDSNFELYAQDEETFQLDFLKQRICDQGYQKERVKYCSNRFPNTDFKGKFEGIIISNLLHFYNFEEIQASLLPPLFKLLKPGSILIVTVHSKKHPSNKEPITNESYFQHFFNRNDLNILFPKDLFHTMFYLTKSSRARVYEKEIYKSWIQQICHNSDIFDERTIQKTQSEFLKGNREENITVVYKMKNIN